MKSQMMNLDIWCLVKRYMGGKTMKEKTIYTRWLAIKLIKARFPVVRVE